MIMSPPTVSLAGTKKEASSKPRRSIADLLSPIEKLAAHSPNLIASRGGSFDIGGQTCELPRYLLVGPKRIITRQAVAD